ncbi:MAG TPA: hypothetical protein VE961_19280 [Pyrinomonadaceae bacterium]|nr:hypothetical protein [Pyrinomonadaceae bacterium]
MAFIIGFAMFATFVGLLIAVLIENKTWPTGFWVVVTAGEVAAWRIKWEVLLISVAALSLTARIVRSISLDPKRYIGLLPAQMGLGGVLTVILLVAALIGITVPERLRQRQYSIDAAMTARGYTVNRALLEYRESHGTLPSNDNYVEELGKVPDPDGSIADALRYLDPKGYSATTTVAVASPKSKPVVGRGSALRGGGRMSSLEPAPVPFTSYTLRLPSEHRWFSSDDDYIMQDGVIKKESDAAPGASLRNP